MVTPGGDLLVIAQQPLTAMETKRISGGCPSAIETCALANCCSAAKGTRLMVDGRSPVMETIKMRQLWWTVVAQQQMEHIRLLLLGHRQ